MSPLKAGNNWARRMREKSTCFLSERDIPLSTSYRYLVHAASLLCEFLPESPAAGRDDLSLRSRCGNGYFAYCAWSIRATTALRRPACRNLRRGRYHPARHGPLPAAGRTDLPAHAWAERRWKSWGIDDLYTWSILWHHEFLLRPGACRSHSTLQRRALIFTCPGAWDSLHLWHGRAVVRDLTALGALRLEIRSSLSPKIAHLASRPSSQHPQCHQPVKRATLTAHGGRNDLGGTRLYRHARAHRVASQLLCLATTHRTNDNECA